eukprot:15439386-Alexandrium_andersonii.AAC.1
MAEMPRREASSPPQRPSQTVSGTSGCAKRRPRLPCQTTRPETAPVGWRPGEGSEGPLRRGGADLHAM